MVSELLLFARYDLGRGGNIVAMPASYPPGLIRGDRRDFGLALLSLLFNASEAMTEKGGTISIGASRDEAGWTISVADRGAGIPPGAEEKLFEEGLHHTARGIPRRHGTAGGEACRRGGRGNGPAGERPRRRVRRDHPASGGTGEVAQMDGYMENYVAGSVQEYGSIKVTEEEIVEFGKRYDPHYFHVDPEKAKKSPYGGLIASGWHTAAMMMRLLVDNFISARASLGSPGVDKLRWVKPVRPGDELSIRVTVQGTRRSRSKPGLGYRRVFRGSDEPAPRNGDDDGHRWKGLVQGEG